MKKTITLMLLLVMAGSAHADLVLKTKGYLYVCPKVLTTSGKTIVYSRDNEGITIYTPDFFVDKTIKAPVQQYESGSFTEKATVTVTGMNVVPGTSYGLQNYSSSYNYSSYGYLSASSQEEMIDWFENNRSYAKPYTAFTDPMGNPACYGTNTSWKLENMFGKQYPTSWYALIDGYVYSINVYDAFYTPSYDEASAVWTRTSEDIRLNEFKTMRNTYFYFEGMGDQQGNDAYVSQSLFNDDDKWEYIVTDYSGPSVITYNSPSYEVNDDGTVTLTRTGNVRPENRGYAVYNEDGEKLGNIPSEYIYVINGKPYAYDYDYDYDYDDNTRYVALYSFDTSGGDTDLVETMRAKGGRSLGAKHGIVTVDINAEQAGGEVVVSTTDGKVLANKKVVAAGQTQVNDQPLPAGIYVVSLLKDGRVVESEKYLVK